MAGIRRKIGLDELDHFTIDADRMIYWDGEAVQTMTKYSLPWWISLSIVLGGFGGALAGVAMIISAIAILHGR